MGWQVHDWVPCWRFWRLAGELHTPPLGRRHLEEAKAPGGLPHPSRHFQKPEQLPVHCSLLCARHSATALLLLLSLRYCFHSTVATVTTASLSVKTPRSHACLFCPLSARTPHFFPPRHLLLRRPWKRAQDDLYISVGAAAVCPGKSTPQWSTSTWPRSRSSSLTQCKTPVAATTVGTLATPRCKCMSLKPSTGTSGQKCGATRTYP